jgi:hypothetical protein
MRFIFRLDAFVMKGFYILEVLMLNGGLIHTSTCLRDPVCQLFFDKNPLFILLACKRPPHRCAMKIREKSIFEFYLISRKSNFSILTTCFKISFIHNTLLLHICLQLLSYIVFIIIFNNC